MDELGYAVNVVMLMAKYGNIHTRIRIMHYNANDMRKQKEKKLRND